jgi:hypothetical protein
VKAQKKTFPSGFSYTDEDVVIASIDAVIDGSDVNIVVATSVGEVDVILDVANTVGGMLAGCWLSATSCCRPRK